MGLIRQVLSPAVVAIMTLLPFGSHAGAANRHVGVTPAEMRAWRWVAHCEEGGNWRVRGAVYSGGLGITNANWREYAPAWFPRNAADATPRQQVYVAMRINRGHPVPDRQGECAPW